MVRAAFAAAIADMWTAITAVQFCYFLDLQPGAGTTTTTTSAAQASSASVGEFDLDILVALVVAVGALYAAVALIYGHIHQAEAAAAAAGAGNRRPLSDRVTFVLLAAVGLLELFLFVVPRAVDDVVGALGLAAFRALPAAATATFFLGMTTLIVVVAHVRAGGEGGGGGGAFVGDGQIRGAVSILTKTGFAAAAGLFFLMAIALAK